MSHPLAYIYRYFTEMGIKLAQKQDAYIFLTTEVGELGDAIMRQQEGWIRNDPNKEISIEDELADVMMMVWVLADSYGIDPETALKNKLKRKLNEHRNNQDSSRITSSTEQRQ